MDEWNKHIPRSSQEAASHCAYEGLSVEEQYVLWQSDVGYRLDVFYRSFWTIYRKLAFLLDAFAILLKAIIIVIIIMLLLLLIYCIFVSINNKNNNTIIIIIIIIIY